MRNFMKAAILAVAVLGCTQAFCQGARFDDFAWTTSQVGANGVNVVTPIAGAAVQFCNSPAVISGGLCTNKATTYTDVTLATPCGATTQVVLQGTISCVATSDAQGNFGVFVAPGNYVYTLSLSGVALTGQFSVSVGVTGTGASTFSDVVYINSQLKTLYPVTGYPGGNDLVLNARGPADIYVEHFNAATTTTASLSAGANTNVPVAAVTFGNQRQTEQTGTTAFFSTLAAISVGRDTANEDVLTYSATVNCPVANTWNIVDGTHLCLNTGHTHTGTTDIDQAGSTVLTSIDLFINSGGVQASHNGRNNSPMRIKGQNAQLLGYWPTANNDTHPYEGWRFVTPLSGEIGNAGYPNTFADLQFRNNLSTSKVIIQKSTNAASLWAADDSGNTVQTLQASASSYLLNQTVTTTSPGLWYQTASGGLTTVTGGAGGVQFNNAINTTAIFNVDNTGVASAAVSMSAPKFLTATNCSGVGTAASPSVASCAAASAGSFSCATNATGATCQVNTTAVTANSQIFVQEDETLGAKLSVTCNTGTNVLPTSRLLAARSAGVSFTINLGTVTTNPACFSYFIVN